jgi:hypothetical protein
MKEDIRWDVLLSLHEMQYRYDLFAALIVNIKNNERKMKKGVDKWGNAWYSNQAVADEAARELKNTEF